MANDAADAKFYYAYCDTEEKRIGKAESDETVAKNRAEHHKAETKHETSVVYE